MCVNISAEIIATGIFVSVIFIRVWPHTILSMYPLEHIQALPNRFMIYGFNGLPWWLSLQSRRPWFDSSVGKMPWRRDRLLTPLFLGFPGGSDGKESSRHGFNLWVGKIPWRRAWQPIPVFLPGESPWTEEPGGLMGSQRVRHNWVTKDNTVYDFNMLAQW